MDDPLDEGAPPLKVTRGLCPAGLGAPDGPRPCKTSAGCLLHPSENEGRRARGEPMLREETVVCARHFWGFRVPIEVPVQQVDGVAGRPPPPIRSQIGSAKPLAFVAAFNPNLDLAAAGPDGGVPVEGPHTRQMRSIVAAASGNFMPPRRNTRQAVIDLLRQAQPDVVYLYCHGVPGGVEQGRTWRDSLDFGRGHAGVRNDLVEGVDLGGPAWTHGPLVFLNGCGTVAFTPYAPSDFVTRFIQGRRASAVIGTEVTVWEVLAREFAAAFFESMLATRRPGEALLVARRALLKKNNPLGLVYTLYGDFELQA